MDSKRIIDKHMSSFHRSLNDFRLSKQFLDFTICVGDKEFQVHKLVMASCSDYFKNLFTHDSLESRNSRMTLEEITVIAVEAIIDFCYNCKLDLTIDNVQEILIAANRLQVTAAQDMCANFITSHLDTSNCIGAATIAHLCGLPDLFESAMKYCIDWFDSVVQTKDFCDLDDELLKKILSHDELYIEDEVQVFNAIVKWIQVDEDNRLEMLDDLMEQVRFALIDPIRLVELGSREYIKNSPRCRDMIDIAKNYLLLKHHPNRSSLIDETQIPNIRPRLASQQRQRIYAVGGWTDEYMSIASAEVYNPNLDQWSELEPMAQKRCGVGLTTLGDSIYAVGGHDGQSYLSSSERYDIKGGFWHKDVADMSHVRTSVGVIALAGQIYAIGGQTCSDATDKVEKYDPKTNTWSSCAVLNRRRLGAGVATLNGCIYVMGGSEGHTIYDSVERYHPDLNIWVKVESMTTARKHLACTTCKNKIYAIGGRNRSGELDSAECYDPRTGIWTPIKPMNMKRSGIGVVELGGLVFAIGGQNEGARLNVVEAYNPETNEWVRKSPMNHRRLGGGMSVHPSGDC